MENQLKYNLRKLLKNLWEDFKNPITPNRGISTCCSYSPSYKEEFLKPQPIPVTRYSNPFTFNKNNQS